MVGSLALGLGVGALVAWLVAAGRSASAQSSAEVEVVRSRSEVEGLRREAATLREQMSQVRHDATTAMREAREDAARQVAAERAEGEARVRELKQDQEAERQRFASVAGTALEANSKQFLELAAQTMRASTVKNEEALVQREQAIRALVEPLSKSLDKVSAQVTEAESQRREGQSRLTEHLRQLEAANADLRKGTGDLVTALRSSQTRGAWGELQLRRVVEAAGMLRHVDFTEQDTVRDGEGRTQRPDMVVRLAGGKQVVVDAKVAFVGYLEAQQSDDPTVREERLDAHVRHMRKHLDDLAGKRYWDQFEAAPEFVVMFVPAEVFLSAAAERDPALLEDAVRRNVIIATPMTLVALLRTVAFAWRQEALATDAAEVLRVGKELYARLVTMTKHVTDTGRSLTRATESYNKMIGSLESMVLTSARRMVDLDVVDAKDAIDELSGIEEVVRPITKPELLAAEEDRVVAIESAQHKG